MSINHRDILKDIQGKVVARLQAQASLEESTGMKLHANYIHEKIVKDVKAYTQAQIPAVGVYCHTIETHGRGLLDIKGVCMITMTGTMETCEDTGKQLVAEVFQHFDTTFIPGFANNADIENIEPISGSLFPVQEAIDYYCQIGLVHFELTIMRFRK